MVAVILPGTGDELVPLDRLVTLEEAGFEDWFYCFRPINEEHVAHLIESNPDTWPRIETVYVQMEGQIYHAVIDGNHRMEAGYKREDIKALRAHSGYYASEDAVIAAAFEANLKHGLAASTSTRGDYAVWLYFHDESKEPNLSAIARKVGLNKSTVSRAVKKALQEQEEQGEENAEGESESTYKAEVTNAEKLVTALHAFFTKERTLRGMFGDGTKQVDATHRAKMIYNHVASMQGEKKQTTLNELVSLRSTLNSFYDTCVSQQRTGTR